MGISSDRLTTDRNHFRRPGCRRGPLREIEVMYRLNQFLAGEDGTTAVEYAVMLALIIAVCITAVASVGSTNDGSLKDSMDRLGAIMGS